MKNTLTIRHDTREIVMDRTFAKYAQNNGDSVLIDNFIGFNEPNGFTSKKRS